MKSRAVILLISLLFVMPAASSERGVIQDWESGDLTGFGQGRNDDVVTVDQTHSYEGNYALHLDVNGDSSDSSYVYKDHSISPGDNFSVWVYSDNLNQEYQTASLILEDSKGNSRVVLKPDIGDFKCTTPSGYNFFGSISEGVWTKLTIEVNTDNTVKCYVDKEGGASYESSKVDITNPSTLDKILLRTNDKGSSINTWFDKLSGPLDEAPGDEVKKVFYHTGSAQQFQVPSNVDKVNFTLYGAGGGENGNNDAGFGGTTTGTLDVSPGDTFELYPGGTPTEASDGADQIVGGWNGGGWGDRDHHYAKGGGGGTDIRYGGTTCNDRIAVAGGGGGHSWDTQAGHGGGTSGGDGNGGAGGGGTQSSGGSDGGSFCSGGSNKDASDGTGGGGGGWYGGGRGSFDDPGGGGSGHCATGSSKISDCATSRGGGGSGDPVARYRQHGNITLEYIKASASNAPVIQSINITPETLRNGTDVDIEVNVTDADSDLQNVTVDVYEGGVQEKSNVMLSESSGTWSSNGLFTVDSGDLDYNISVKAMDDNSLSDSDFKKEYLGRMDLSWSHSDSPTGFKIYTNATESESDVGSSVSESFAYISSQMKQGGYYCFNVTAYNQYGESEPLSGCGTN